jgi:FkbM family methyltransferase
MKTVTSSPLLFKLAKQLIRHNVRGGYRLIDTGQRLGLFDVEVRHKLDDRITIDIPIYREATPWDAKDILEYETAHVDYVAAVANKMQKPVLFLDCGADIGTFSVLMAMKCPSLDRIIAFEPNKVAFAVLKTNLGRLPIPSEVKCVAVSDFVGKGELVAPALDKSEHAFFLEKSTNGTIPVTRLDELDLRWEDFSVVLKLDVEGNELKVLEGAKTALTRARAFAVSIEANRKVAERTRKDPMESWKFLQDLRKCKATVTERLDWTLKAEPDIFQQLDGRVYNVVCESTA